MMSVGWWVGGRGDINRTWLTLLAFLPFPHSPTSASHDVEKVMCVDERSVMCVLYSSTHTHTHTHTQPGR